ncbi:MAG: hypothetical protein O7C75_15505, partial [Verrucomicrobia bacterium]|nr:hypothetical protein [Verrucomicrobiota bacterium]
MMKYKLFAGVLCGVFLINVAVDAGVERIDITERTHYLDGQSFGETGPYEKLSGRVYYTVDPAGTLNQTIVDLEGAPRNKAGLVEYSADILVLVPADRTKVNGTLIYEVNNRGGSPLLRFEQPSYKLLGRGYTIVLSGWIGELLPKTERLRLHAPVA